MTDTEGRCLLQWSVDGHTIVNRTVTKVQGAGDTQGMNDKEMDKGDINAFDQGSGRVPNSDATSRNVVSASPNKSGDGDRTVDNPTPLTRMECDDNENQHRHGGAKRRRLTTAGYITLAITIVLAGVYGYGVDRYATHLFPSTTVDGVDVGEMTVEEAERATDACDWNVTIKDVTGDVTTLGIDQVGLKVGGKTPRQMLDGQNPYEWPMHMHGTNETTQRTTEYDADTLKAAISGLDMTNMDRRTPPTDATYRHDKADGQWHVIPDVRGDLVDVDKLYDAVADAIDGFNQAEVEVTQDMLVQPRVTSSDESLNAAVADANKWSKASITYDIDDIPSAETLDSSMIAGWVSVMRDERGTFSATLDEASIRTYLTTIGRRYDTQGNPVTITSPDGRTIDVPGTEQDTGWVTDEGGEYDRLVTDIKEGKDVHREFTMRQRAGSKSGVDIWGTTYIEVDLSSQRCWYVANGEVRASFGIVSGKDGYDTPTGVTKVYKKVTDVVLVSPWKDPATGEPTYKTHIDVGLVISADGGILIHDAPWQPESGFGDASYHHHGGSHGCVNAMGSDVWGLYDIVSTGTPVVTHD